MPNMQHQQLAEGGWEKLSLAEQLAHVGSEVIRAMNWQDKGNAQYANKAFHRSLELMQLTATANRHHPGLKEITRMRELWIDYFYGDNQYHQTRQQWENYFLHFTKLARKNRYIKTKSSIT